MRSHSKPAHAKLAGICLTAAMAASMAFPASAQQQQPLSAQESDPRVMGWMQGSPPPPDKIITQPDSVYFSFPRLRWSVCHLREFLPTEEISRGLEAPAPLEYLPPAQFADMRQAIDALTFTPMNASQPMTWEQSLYANYTDGMLILHKGKVVYERYFGCLEEDGKHATMSMTKFVTELASERLWRPMGAEQDAYQTVDGKGVPFAGGGLTAGLRDLGRLGQLMLNEGVIKGEGLFPAEVARRIRQGGDPSKFAGFPTIPNGSYTSQWWVFHNDHGAYAARGVHGQTIYVDPTAEMVLVRFASFPTAANGRIDPTSLPASQFMSLWLSPRRSLRARRRGPVRDRFRAGSAPSSRPCPRFPAGAR